MNHIAKCEENNAIVTVLKQWLVDWNFPWCFKSGSNRGRFYCFILFLFSPGYLLESPGTWETFKTTNAWISGQLNQNLIVVGSGYQYFFRSSPDDCNVKPGWAPLF